MMGFLLMSPQEDRGGQQIKKINRHLFLMVVSNKPITINQLSCYTAGFRKLFIFLLFGNKFISILHDTFLVFRPCFKLFQLDVYYIEK